MVPEKQKNPTDLPQNAEDMICFAIYTAGHALNRMYNPLLRKLGLTYPQYITMTMLWQSGEITVGALAERLKLETNTLTPLLKRLEISGHIERRKSNDDARQVYVSVTRKGKEIQKYSSDITRCIIDATGYDVPVLEALVASISQLRDQVTESAEKLRSEG
ncbi:MarR family transcriptional regulator [Sneathiella marina]|uniref:MarR family transcriptional regulator n=1 Tax=Sneathiella marina TaxID=2950108 RepID=A0ABY4WB23_9PROT|nr:MarR family transcriptional regulator [Sneathiella marina]USG63122.1 MarR family transcriptional regulator [Sneathiella marina]